jgi:hypothetical protein
LVWELPAPRAADNGTKLWALRELFVWKGAEISAS